MTDRLTPEASVVVVIDLQEKLLGVVPDATAVIEAVAFLLDVAHLMGVPTPATEQYPHGLGPTTPDLARRLPDPIAAKTRFSAGDVLEPKFAEYSQHAFVLVGVETHVCVAQTALDLLRRGHRVTIAVDGVGSRRRLDHDTALCRLEAAGATLSTVEAVAFEWLADSTHPQFKAVSQLVRQRAVD
jgi:nicotinamidase-related amidase